MENMRQLQQHLEAGAIQIAKAMWGTYNDPNGVTRHVGGDTTKVRWVPGLSPAAHHLWHHVEHCRQSLLATHEARSIMCFDTQAHRVRYGTPVVVTLFSR